MPHLVRSTWRRLNHTLSAADRAPRGPEQDALRHQVRKDVKRSRYAEVVQLANGRDAHRYASAITTLQESLGDFQDGVGTRKVLREMGARGHLAGENAFTFGGLHALEQMRTGAAVARLPQGHAAVSRRRLRRWFDQEAPRWGVERTALGRIGACPAARR